jgi:hypothetical protein
MGKLRLASPCKLDALFRLLWYAKAWTPTITLNREINSDQITSASSTLRIGVGKNGVLMGNFL